MDILGTKQGGLLQKSTLKLQLSVALGIGPIREECFSPSHLKTRTSSFRNFFLLFLLLVDGQSQETQYFQLWFITDRILYIRPWKLLITKGMTYWLYKWTHLMLQNLPGAVASYLVDKSPANMEPNNSLPV